MQSFRLATLAPIAGSLFGSVLCFLHGCYLIVESFLDWYGGDVEESDEDSGETMRSLVEAIDMYLLGSGMLNFGFGLYVVFVSGSEGGKFRRLRRGGGGGYRWGNQIGRAVVMMLQSGIVDKIKNIPMVTGVDLVCFTGALFVSSAALFVLSKLGWKKKKGGDVL